MHPLAYAVIALAAGFGGVAAYVTLSDNKAPAPPPTIHVVTVTAPPTQTAVPTAAAAGESQNDVTPASTKAGNGSGRVTTAKLPNGAKPAASAPEETAAAATPISVGLGDGPALDGPNVGLPSTTNNSLPQQLDQSDIERVVSSQRAFVKRRCWEPALTGRDPSAPRSASVVVSLVIAPSGRVQSASASGGDGYPGLASCVQSSVRGWTFPPSGGESQASIPFKFFSQ